MGNEHWPPHCSAENNKRRGAPRRKCLILLVEQRGIEPLASALRTRRSAKLSYCPTRKTILPCRVSGFKFWSNRPDPRSHTKQHETWSLVTSSQLLTSNKARVQSVRLRARCSRAEQCSLGVW